MKPKAISKPLQFTVGLLFAAMSIIITPYAAYGSTIGAPLVNRALTDTAGGTIYALNTGFNQSGILSNWAFYNDNPTQIGYEITPLLLDVVGGDYVIIGVGTSRTNSATGVQTFNFGLTAGTDTVSPNLLFGWKDGTDTDPAQTGVIELDFVNSATVGTQQFFGSGLPGVSGHSGDLFPGSNLGAGRTMGVDVGQLDRDYSIQATVSAVPVPAAMYLFGSSLIGLLGMRKKVAS
ncbi:MAG: hypothetical protein ABL903_19685 [Methylococcales bacterium]